jgi:hypothetical protein
LTSSSSACENRVEALVVTEDVSVRVGYLALACLVPEVFPAWEPSAESAARVSDGTGVSLSLASGRSSFKPTFGREVKHNADPSHLHHIAAAFFTDPPHGRFGQTPDSEQSEQPVLC